MNLEELQTIMNDMLTPQSVFYRLYHDSQGQPLFYSMEDLPGTYINVDQAVYAKNNLHVKVVDGRLIEITWQIVSKLVPGVVGTQCDPRDVAVVTDSNTGIKWSKKFHEFN
jgi:hypothetical protein